MRFKNKTIKITHNTNMRYVDPIWKTVKCPISLGQTQKCRSHHKSMKCWVTSGPNNGVMACYGAFQIWILAQHAKQHAFGDYLTGTQAFIGPPCPPPPSHKVDKKNKFWDMDQYSKHSSIQPENGASASGYWWMDIQMVSVGLSQTTMLWLSPVSVASAQRIWFTGWARYMQ